MPTTSNLSFSPYKCFHTFAVWKHFLIYTYQKIGCPYPTANSSFSSVCSRTTCRLKKSSPSAYSNGLTSDSCAAPPTTPSSSSGPPTEAGSHAYPPADSVCHSSPRLPKDIPDIPDSHHQDRQGSSARSRLPTHPIRHVHILRQLLPGIPANEGRGAAEGTHATSIPGHQATLPDTPDSIQCLLLVCIAEAILRPTISALPAADVS